jgi:DNA modification methylase
MLPKRSAKLRWPPTAHSALGPYRAERVTLGDSLALIAGLPDDSVDILITSPPYWGQRAGAGIGLETDPRSYLTRLTAIFVAALPKLKPTGIAWINLGDAYDTPVNWREADRAYSTLGPTSSGLAPRNSAYVKPRGRRRAFLDPATPWLRYGNLLALPYRLVVALCDAGWLFRGEVVWRKKNPLPEGRCRRPHRHHESLYLLARSEHHAFRRSPPVKSVWELANEKLTGKAHYSRFPEQLPLRCIEAYGAAGRDVVVLDPFAGSGTTGIAAHRLGCTFVGFDIDPDQVAAANARLAQSARSRRAASSSTSSSLAKQNRHSVSPTGSV